MRKLSKLTQELALALEVASHAQAWGNPSPFQDKINELLVKAGREPVAHLTKRVPDGAEVCAECGFPPSHHDPSCYVRRKSPRR